MLVKVAAVSSIRYPARILDCTKAELAEMDAMARRKISTMNGIFYEEEV